MSEKVILAEKIVALIFTHNAKARDLYDIFFLIRKGAKIEVGLVDRKMREYGHMFTKKQLDHRMHLIKRIWNKELPRLLPENEFVAYDKVQKYVMESFKAAGLI